MMRLVFLVRRVRLSIDGGILSICFAAAFRTDAIKSTSSLTVGAVGPGFGSAFSFAPMPEITPPITSCSNAPQPGSGTAPLVIPKRPGVFAVWKVGRYSFCSSLSNSDICDALTRTFGRKSLSSSARNSALPWFTFVSGSNRTVGSKPKAAFGVVRTGPVNSLSTAL